MHPLCSFCPAFALVVRVTERVGDGSVIDQTFFCEGHAKFEGVPTGGPALALVGRVEAAPEMGQ